MLDQYRQTSHTHYVWLLQCKGIFILIFKKGHIPRYHSVLTHPVAEFSILVLPINSIHMYSTMTTHHDLRISKILPTASQCQWEGLVYTCIVTCPLYGRLKSHTFWLHLHNLPTKAKLPYLFKIRYIITVSQYGYTNLNCIINHSLYSHQYTCHFDYTVNYTFIHSYFPLNYDQQTIIGCFKKQLFLTSPICTIKRTTAF
jgi:hypothetical protein